MERAVNELPDAGFNALVPECVEPRHNLHHRSRYAPTKPALEIRWAGEVDPICSLSPLGRRRGMHVIPWFSSTGSWSRLIRIW